MENLHFLSPKPALWAPGEWTRCPLRAHGEPSAGWGIKAALRGWVPPTGAPARVHTLSRRG